MNGKHVGLGIVAGLKVIAATTLLSAAGTNSASASTIGPSPYRCFDSTVVAGCNSNRDSPLKDASYSYFYLEDFEDAALNTPGVSTLFIHASPPGNPSNSVDGDDGLIDGAGRGTRSASITVSDLGTTFWFDAEVLGQLPNTVGLVWTDVGSIGFSGDPPPLPPNEYYSFEFLGADGSVIGQSVSTLGSGDFTGQAADDRFIGWRGTEAVGGIRIKQVNGEFRSLSIDHLQYGFATPAVPEPATWAMMIAGFGAVGSAMRRRRVRRALQQV